MYESAPTRTDIKICIISHMLICSHLSKISPNPQLTLYFRQIVQPRLCAIPDRSAYLRRLICVFLYLCVVTRNSLETRSPGSIPTLYGI